VLEIQSANYLETINKVLEIYIESANYLQTTNKELEIYSKCKCTKSKLSSKYNKILEKYTKSKGNVSTLF